MFYAIDPRWLKLAVLSAQADVEAKRHEMLMRQDAARRRALIKGSFPARISSKQAAQRASRRPIIRGAGCAGTGAAEFIPCNGARPGYRLRDASSAPPGDYAAAGETKIAVVDAHSFWVVGYFEETSCVIFASGAPHTFR